MSVQDEPVPPVPEHTPPKKEDEGSPNSGKYFSPVWTRWFISIREKINVINDVVASLSRLLGSGGIVTVDPNGDAAVVETTDLVAGSNVSFDVSGSGRILDNGSGPLTISASGGGGGGIDLVNKAAIYSEFFQGAQVSSNSGTSFLSTGVPVVYTFGTSSGFTITSDVGRPARISLSTGTASAGYVRLITTGPPSILLGGGAIKVGFYFNIPILSEVLQQYQLQIGLFDRISGAATDTIALFYDHAVNSGQWVLSITENTVTSTINTAIPVTTNETLVEFIFNSAGSSVEVFIDNVSAAMSAVNISNPLTVGVKHSKQTGTQARLILFDYITFEQTLTTPRN